MSSLKFFTPKAKVVEVFRSIQGEGKYLGVSQVFIRFYGCSVQCSWCDTPEGRQGERYEKYLPEALLKDVLDLSVAVHSLSLTGGEPLEQKEFLKEFLPLVKQKGLTVYLETNGLLDSALHELEEYVDIIAMDIKLPTSSLQRPFWVEHEAFLRIASRKDTFVKVVISLEASEQDILAAAKLVSKINRDMIFILQPNQFDLEKGVVQKCYEAQIKCLAFLSDVRVIPQVHKTIGIK